MAKLGKSAENASPRATRAALAVALSVLLALAGIGFAALAGRFGPPLDWSVLGDIGQTFGVASALISGLALIAVVRSDRAQSRQLQEQRHELELQREILRQSHLEWQRSAEAGRGQLHLEMLKLAMDNPDLAEVWPPFAPDLSAKQNRQYLYANVIYQYQQTWMTISDHTEEDFLAAVRYLFTNPIMRDYWRAAAGARSSLVPGTEECRRSEKVDDLLREYEAVAATVKATRPKVKNLRAAKGRATNEPPDDDPLTPAA